MLSRTDVCRVKARIRIAKSTMRAWLAFDQKVTCRCRAAAYSFNVAYRHDRHADAYLFPNRFNAARPSSNADGERHRRRAHGVWASGCVRVTYYHHDDTMISFCTSTTIIKYAAASVSRSAAAEDPDHIKLGVLSNPTFASVAWGARPTLIKNCLLQ
jgi:hypothetical protein